MKKLRDLKDSDDHYMFVYMWVAMMSVTTTSVRGGKLFGRVFFLLLIAGWRPPLECPQKADLVNLLFTIRNSKQ